MTGRGLTVIKTVLVTLTQGPVPSGSLDVNVRVTEPDVIDGV